MLSQKYRFHSRGGVKYVYKKGKTVRRAGFSLVFCENTRGFIRIAVVVSKKVAKTAVARNRIRRRVYEAIRKNMEFIPLKQDYIFVVYDKKAGEMPYDDLVKSLGELVAESKVCYNR
ncbi:ribonuclease P protein component [Candidatus Saccharibacteria bacterium]|nr:ribonuclease P protein component [Candidatus Saccharibacteria bacterium]MBR0424025.1 ribonuclease P protein component [Candidatus Saccharibacteria bacterium]